MTEILDKKPPKPVTIFKKLKQAKLFFSQEPVESDLNCEYAPDILETYFANEIEVNSNFLTKQAEYTYKYRAILIDWIHSIHKRFKLQDDTLFLAVQILDRYASRRSIRVSQMQLLGITSLLIACKYEEVFIPGLNELLKTMESVFLKDQIIQLEKDILLQLEYTLTAPTSLKFFARFSQILNISGNMFSFGLYLLELSFDYNLISFKQSIIASSAVILTHILFHKDIPCKLKENVIIDSEIKNCINQMIVLLEFSRENPLKSVWDKFSKRRYHCVSSLNLL